jgi:transcription antitermination factor NusG
MLNWYALQIQSRLGRMASTALRTKGYDEFLPVYRTHRKCLHHVKDIEVPLFPGYLFCRLDPSGRILPVLTTPGVIRIVSFGRVPIAMSEQEIEAVRKVILSGLTAEPCAFAEAGCRVVLERGPLAGLEGLVISVAGSQRLVVSITLLQRSVSVEIDRGWVRALSPATVPLAAGMARTHQDQTLRWVA